MPQVKLKRPRVLYWTQHSKSKMLFYRLSPGKVRSVIHSPKRIEEGVAPKTIAMMKPAGNTKHQHEIWVMVQDVKDKRKIISAWRYPGITKPGAPLPAEVLHEIKVALAYH